MRAALFTIAAHGQCSVQHAKFMSHLVSNFYVNGIEVSHNWSKSDSLALIDARAARFGADIWLAFDGQITLADPASDETFQATIRALLAHANHPDISEAERAVILKHTIPLFEYVAPDEFGDCSAYATETMRGKRIWLEPSQPSPNVVAMGAVVGRDRNQRMMALAGVSRIISYAATISTE